LTQSLTGSGWWWNEQRVAELVLQYNKEQKEQVLSELYPYLQKLIDRAIGKQIRLYGFIPRRLLDFSDIHHDCFLILTESLKTYNSSKSTLWWWANIILKRHLNTMFFEGHQEDKSLEELNPDALEVQELTSTEIDIEPNGQAVEAMVTIGGPLKYWSILRLLSLTCTTPLSCLSSISGTVTKGKYGSFSNGSNQESLTRQVMLPK
jgi:hypothetical protein